MLAIGYCRVSTAKQSEKGISLDAQVEKIRAMAVVHGAELLDVVQDGGESAKTLNRPGVQRVLKLVHERQVRAVIVAKLDRLTRSVKDLCELLELFERRVVGRRQGREVARWAFKHFLRPVHDNGDDDEGDDED
jgi:site-specific DNA recombinase